MDVPHRRLARRKTGALLASRPWAQLDRVLRLDSPGRLPYHGRMRARSELPTADQLLRAVSPVLACYPEIAVAYVFGSFARGRARVDSDVDIGIVLRERGQSLALDRLDALVLELS